jgi:hypothetical protein
LQSGYTAAELHQFIGLAEQAQPTSTKGARGWVTLALPTVAAAAERTVVISQHLLHQHQVEQIANEEQQQQQLKKQRTEKPAVIVPPSSRAVLPRAARNPTVQETVSKTRVVVDTHAACRHIAPTSVVCCPSDMSSSPPLTSRVGTNRCSYINSTL